MHEKNKPRKYANVQRIMLDRIMTPEFSLQRNTERFSTNDLNPLLQKLLIVIKK